MTIYKIFQQQFPRAIQYTNKGEKVIEFVPNLKYLGTLEVPVGECPIDFARKTFTEFKIASRATLGAFPIVEKL